MKILTCKKTICPHCDGDGEIGGDEQLNSTPYKKLYDFVKANEGFFIERSYVDIDILMKMEKFSSNYSLKELSNLDFIETSKALQNTYEKKISSQLINIMKEFKIDNFEIL